MQARKLLPLLVLIVLLSLSIVVWFYPPTGDFRTDNPFWNGLSTYSNQAKVTTLNSYSNLPSSPKGTALIVIPYEQFTGSEITQLKSYVLGGGTLVLMDDYGFGNQMLSGFGLSLRFTGDPLLDPLYCYRNEWLPQISDFSNSSVTANVTSIVFNHTTCLNNTAGATIIAQSSVFSFLDVNDTGVWAAGDPVGPLPVAAYVTLGQGYVIAVADPSVLINSMISMNSNYQFISNLVSIHSANPKVFVDQTHLPASTLDDSKAFLAAIYGVVTYPLVTLSVIIVVLAYSLKPIWSNGGKHEKKR